MMTATLKDMQLVDFKSGHLSLLIDSNALSSYSNATQQQNKRLTYEHS